MIDTESYGVSGRPLLSSKQVPASGRVCSYRNPRMWPCSRTKMSPSSQLQELTSDDALTRLLRLLLVLLGKNARAIFCFFLMVSTENTTAVLRLVQLFR